jgi:aminopeptidase N
MGVGFSNNYVSTTQHWMPCYDHPSDKATFTGRFRIPAGMMVASNGLVAEKIPEEDGSVTWVWDHVHPAATYLLTFAVAPYVELNVGPVDLPMLLYTLPVDSAATRRSFALLPEMVNWFEESYGDYPFEKVGYVNTPQGAMEHQTMVSFPTSLSRTGDSLNLVGAHELAHQWFGDLVSPVDFRHSWLNESFATFSEALWLERVGGGYQAYLGGITGNLMSYLGSDVAREGVLPLYDFPRAAPSSNYPATIYNKGAVVVGMLRYELGEVGFFAAMKRYLGNHAYGTASTDDLLELIEDMTGREFDWFFDQWVVRKGWPIFEVAGRPTEVPGQFSVTLRQVQPEEFGLFTNVPLEIGFLTSSGLVHRLVRVDSAEQSWTFNIGSSIDDLLFNQGPNIRTLAQFSVEISDVEEGEARFSGLLYQVRTSHDGGSGYVLERRGQMPPGMTSVVSIYDTGGRLRGTTRVDSFPFRPDGPRLESGAYILVVEEGEDGHALPMIIRQ